MRVFVAGGSGAVGRRLVPRLVARGHPVTATRTNPNKRQMLEQLGATAAIMDGLNAAQVGEAVAVAEPDAVVHQTTSIGPPDLRHFDRWFAQSTGCAARGSTICWLPCEPRACRTSWRRALERGTANERADG